jgi:flagellar biosynthesis protein FlhG
MRRARRIITVGGGKGGVGKSVVAANLSVAMAQAGAEVVLVDADLGAANQHTLFGLERPGPTVQSFLDHEVESLEAARTPTLLPRLSLVRGASAVFGAANPTWAEKQRLLRHLEGLDAAVVVVDVGAGTAFNQLDLFGAGDLKVVVLAPQLTALENAYAFVKGSVYRVLGPLLETHGFKGLLEGPAAETARVSLLLGEALACSPKLAAEVEELLRSQRMTLFGNLLNDPREAAVLPALQKMMRDFLSLEVSTLGHARTTQAVHDSVNRRRPVVLEAPHDEAAMAFRRAAVALLEVPLGRTFPQPRRAA